MAWKQMKPVKRNKLRIAAGRLYYTAGRYIRWYFDGKKYCRNRASEKLIYICAEHATPLLRKLSNVDMWLQYNKIDNLKLAVKKLDGIIIYPGETFSYWRLIGKPTKRKGYKEGMTLYYGGFRPGIGGGLCQLSNLIYWLTLHTPLTVTERYRHSYDVFPDSDRRQPFGSGATCVYNYRDLQLYNGTGQAYQLCIEVTGENLAGEWRTACRPQLKYRIYEKEHCITHEFWGGYIRHNKIFRETYSIDGTKLMDEYITENHAVMMYQPFLSSCSEENENGNSGSDR